MQLPTSSLPAIAIAGREATLAALGALATCYHGKRGAWLDQIEAAAIRELKGAVTEGIDICDEVAALEDAIVFLRVVFQGVRDRLQPGD